MYKLGHLPIKLRDYKVWYIYIYISISKIHTIYIYHASIRNQIHIHIYNKGLGLVCISHIWPKFHIVLHEFMKCHCMVIALDTCLSIKNKWARIIKQRPCMHDKDPSAKALSKLSKLISTITYIIYWPSVMHVLCGIWGVLITWGLRPLVKLQNKWQSIALVIKTLRQSR